MSAEITAAWLSRFQQALAEHDNAKRPAEISPELWGSIREGLLSQIRDLEEELDGS